MAGINWYSGYPINQKSCMTKPVPLCSLTNLQLRFLCPSDLEEDRGILSQSFSKQTEVGYILSLGVSKDHRRNGIASLLLDNLISHLTTVEHVDYYIPSSPITTPLRGNVKMASPMCSTLMVDILRGEYNILFNTLMTEYNVESMVSESVPVFEVQNMATLDDEEEEEMDEVIISCTGYL
ncbi:hypothetical protein C0J52_13885 [Blattella germanica]|nr:hypothetical protein C0J52_13885 [Blattella germanica]